MKEKLSYLFFLLAVAVGILVTPVAEKLPEKKISQPPRKDSVVTVRLSAVGDLMCHSTQFNYAQVSKDSFNFKPVFDSVKKFLRSSDFVAGNLETVIADSDSVYSGYPVFNTPDDFLEGLKYAGFTHLILANNHILDRGLKGLFGTIKKVEKFGFTFSGAYSSLKEKERVRLYNLKGIKIAFLSFTYFTNNQNPEARKYVEIIRLAELRRKIALAKKAGADFVILYFHFGNEYERFPNAVQKRIVKNAVKFGADIIVASHTHAVQPIDFIKRNDTDSVFVIYSMGNFISNQRWRYSDGGVIVNIDLAKNVTKDSTFVKDYSYLPVWVFKGRIKGKKRYLILPLSKERLKKPPAFFSKQDSLQAVQSFFDTDSILHAYGAKVSNAIK